jgi:enoyl-CoA hydratase
MANVLAEPVPGLRIEWRESSLHLRIARPDEGNILSLEMIRALSGAIWAADRAQVILLHSEGPDFCLGRDHGVSRPKVAPVATEVRENLARPLMALYEAISAAPVPVICAVQGRASGLGCALATCCDITIAAADARFGLPEMKHDLPPTLAIFGMMTRIPRKTLGWLVYGMGEISAADARQFGMVSEVVPPGELTAAVGRIEAALSARSREAVTAVKEYLRSAPSMSPQGAADYATSLLAGVMSSKRARSEAE